MPGLSWQLNPTIDAIDYAVEKQGLAGRVTLGRLTTFGKAGLYAYQQFSSRPQPTSEEYAEIDRRLAMFGSALQGFEVGRSRAPYMRGTIALATDLATTGVDSAATAFVLYDVKYLNGKLGTYSAYDASRPKIVEFVDALATAAAVIYADAVHHGIPTTTSEVVDGLNEVGSEISRIPSITDPGRIMRIWY